MKRIFTNKVTKGMLFLLSLFMILFSNGQNVTAQDKLIGKEIVLIDQKLADLNVLTQALKPNVKLVLYDDRTPIITEISTVLRENAPVASLHVIMHGAEGALFTPSSFLNTTTLQNQKAEISNWKNSFTPNGSILLYGCNVAQGDSGKQFCTHLAETAGVDVSASTNLTGSSKLGGDWNLEYNTKDISHSICFTSDIQSYNYSLSKVLFWLGAANGGYGLAAYNYYSGLAGTTAVKLVDNVSTISNLSDCALVFMVLPDRILNPTEIGYLKAHIDKGGRIIFVGENSYFKASNDVITSIVASLGGHLSIQSLGLDYGDYLPNTNINMSSDLMQGVTKLFGAAVSAINIGGIASVLVKSIDDPTKIVMAQEMLSNGDIVAWADVNFWDNLSNPSYGTATFFNNILNKAAARITSLTYATLSTTQASSVSGTSAVSGGNITSDNGSTITQRGVCWSSSNASPTTADSKVIDANGGSGSFSDNLTGLSINTTYYARAFATNSLGTAYGNTISFTTTSGAIAPTAVADNFSCSLGGSISGNVMSNDIAGSTPTMTATMVISPSYNTGTFTLSANGSFSYTNNGVSHPSDFFSYYLSDGTSTSATVGVSILLGTSVDAPSALSYAGSPVVATINTTNVFASPTVTGNVVSYGISPALPTGVTLNTTTGVISGTPTILSPLTSYTVTATNTGGSTTATFPLTVNDIAPSALSYTTPNVYTKSVAITSLSPSNSGGAVVSYSVSPALPAGLSLNTSTGVISGTPTAITAIADYTVTATNTGGNTSKVISITVNDIAPSALSYTTPNVYSKSVAITSLSPSNSGGAVVSYSVSPALPAGLSLNTSTGVISGTPTAITAITDYTVTATNTGGNTTKVIRITVNDIAPSALSYTTPNVYTKSVAITSLSPSNSGGAVVSYSVSPALPAGLSLNTLTGLISGTPTAITPIAAYTVTATNTGGNTTKVISITVNDVAPSVLSYTTPNVFTKSVAITSLSPSNSGGAVVSYSVSPALPAGLSLNTSTGLISGTPTAITAIASYTITATNTGGNTTKVISITVNDIPPTGLSYANSPVVVTINTTNLSASPTVTGIVVSYSISPTLPAGLTLNTTTGVISGIPTVLSTLTNYTVTATNTGGSTTTTFILTVNDIAPSALSYANSPAVVTINTTNVSASPTVTGNIVSYSISPALPAGVTLNTTTGVISGTPTVLSTVTNYTVTATNTGGSTSATYKLTVKAIAPTALSYSISPVVAKINTTNVSASPTVTGIIVSYSISPALPAGVTLNTTTGVITGTPSVLSTVTNYTVTATNTGGSTSATFTLTVNDIAPTALLYDNSLVVATINTTNVSATPTVTGNVISYSISPALPAGLTFNTTTGIISGTPTVMSTATIYAVTATNTGGSTTATFTLTVNDIAPTALSYVNSPVFVTVNITNLSASPTVTGNVVSYSISPALPTGITINATTGLISGTPTALSPVTNYTITATNSGGSTTATFTLTVNDIAPGPLSYAGGPVIATINTTNVSVSPTITGNIVSYSIFPALPAGITLNTTTGVISGKPTVLSTLTNYLVTATSSGGSSTAIFTLTVKAIAPTALSYTLSPVVATINTTNVSASPTVTGIIVSYNISPALPTGLSMNTNTGVISGTPTVLSTITNYTVTATNTGGSTTATFTLTVNAIPPTALSVNQSSVVSVISSGNISVTPIVTGIGVTFSISPALPAGVTLNPSTGFVSGTPTVLMALTTYTLTATNSGGSASITFSITVTPAVPTAVSAQAVCGSGIVSDLVAIAPVGSTVRWYTTATGGTSLATTTALVTATTYYAESWNSIVPSSGRTPVMLTINTIPAQPVVVPTSTAKNKVKLCPGDYLICSNFDNTLSYQWRLNGTDLSGQTSYQYKVPVGGNGTYSLYVRNPTTGCNNLSATVGVAMYTVTTPVIFEKKQSDKISILIVDNRSNANISYLWTYADGSALPASIVNNRQFLVLPPSNMAATYMVNVTDSNACKVTSQIKAVTLKSTTAKAYPTMNNGSFKVSLTDAQQGRLNVKIYTQMGLLLKTLTFDNVSSKFEYQINAADLKKGFYIVEISLGDFVQSQKMIIQ